MAKVDKGALEAALDEMASVGLIRSWQSRPLGMYMIEVLGGEVMRPDAKETAMWVQGVLYGSKAEELRGLLVRETEVDRPSMENVLDVLAAVDVLDAWALDDDGDYVVQPAKGPARSVSAQDMRAWLQGAATALGLNAAGAGQAPPTRSQGGGTSAKQSAAGPLAAGQGPQYINGVCTGCGKAVDPGMTAMHPRYCAGRKA